MEPEANQDEKEMASNKQEGFDPENLNDPDYWNNPESLGIWEDQLNDALEWAETNISNAPGGIAVAEMFGQFNPPENRTIQELPPAFRRELVKGLRNYAQGEGLKLNITINDNGNLRLATPGEKILMDQVVDITFMPGEPPPERKEVTVENYTMSADCQFCDRHLEFTGTLTFDVLHGKSGNFEVEGKRYHASKGITHPGWEAQIRCPGGGPKPHDTSIPHAPWLRGRSTQEIEKQFKTPRKPRYKFS